MAAYFPSDESLALPKERALDRVKKALRWLTESWEATAMTVLRLQAPFVLDDKRPQRTDDLVRGIFDFAASLQAATDAEGAPTPEHQQSENADAADTPTAAATAADAAAAAAAAAAAESSADGGAEATTPDTARLDNPELGIAFAVSPRASTFWSARRLLVAADPSEPPSGGAEGATVVSAAPPEMGPSALLNAAATEIRSLLQQHESVPRLVRALNRQRTRNVNVGLAYPFIAGILLSVLDHCLDTKEDVESVLNSMMLSQSFYRLTTAADGSGPSMGRGGVGGVRSFRWRISSTSDGLRREFLKSALENHPLWHDQSFWHIALRVCVAKQERLGYQTLDRSEKPKPEEVAGVGAGGRGRGGGSSSTPASPSPPTSPQPTATAAAAAAAAAASAAASAAAHAPQSPLSFFGIMSSAEAAQARATKQAMEETKKVVFSQLGGIVHSMMEFGLTSQEVEVFVERVCDAHGLTQVQEHAVMTHVEAVAAARGEATFEQW